MDNIFISFDKKAELGIGYGLVADLAVSSSLWATFQIILFQWPDLSKYKMKRIPYLDMRNRMVSFWHGLISMLLVTYMHFTQDQFCGSLTSQMEYFILVNSSGYFIYDFCSMAYFGLLDFDMTVHHMLCIVGMVYTLLLGKGANFVSMGLLVAEVSNPYMHSRMMLKYIGLRYSRAYEMAEFGYFVSFFIGRFLIGLPIVYATLTCGELNLLAKFVCVGVLAQSFQFLYRMYFIVVRRFEEIAERN